MSEPSKPGQCSITEAFEYLTPLPRNSKRWQTLTASVCYFIGKDMQPYDCVTDLVTCLNHSSLDTFNNNGT